MVCSIQARTEQADEPLLPEGGGRAEKGRPTVWPFQRTQGDQQQEIDRITIQCVVAYFFRRDLVLFPADFVRLHEPERELRFRAGGLFGWWGGRFPGGWGSLVFPGLLAL